MKTIELNGRMVRLTTRHYGGGQFYTWAEWKNESGNWVSVGDPYPASTFARKHLAREVPQVGECYLPRLHHQIGDMNP